MSVQQVAMSLTRKTSSHGPTGAVYTSVAPLAALISGIGNAASLEVRAVRGQRQ
jgi:hypothetical protein